LAEIVNLTERMAARQAQNQKRDVSAFENLLQISLDTPDPMLSIATIAGMSIQALVAIYRVPEEEIVEFVRGQVRLQQQAAQDDPGAAR
jgi:hypothetical protein